jgi:lysophospholipase L1-like esterase
MAEASPRQRLLIRGLALLIVLLALGGGGALWWSRTRLTSEPITEPWDQVHNQLWLRPKLRGALLMAPDRPHSPDEVQQSRGTGRPAITRTRTYRLSTNSQRLRGPEVGPKPAGTFRIVALGESVTHGWGVEEEETYPHQLELELRRRGHAVEVLNAGCPAAGVATMAAFCQNVAPQLETDLLIWSRRRDDGYGGQRGVADQIMQCQGGLRRPVVVALPPLSTFDPLAFERSEDERAEMERLLRHRGIPVIDLTPVLAAAQKGRGEVLVHEGGRFKVIDQEADDRVLLEAAATERGLPAEIYQLFERDADVAEALFFDGAHPNAEGFVVYARAVADLVEPFLPAL